MLRVPTDRKELVKFALETVGICNASQGTRAAYYRVLNVISETGRADGDSRSLINLLYAHLDRLAAHLYSPTDLKFSIDFENMYPPVVGEQGEVAADVLTRDWERNNTDMVFGQGVFESLRFGSCFLKQWTEQEGEDMTNVPRSSLVMPWQFGVYREDINNLGKQEALCETIPLSLPEVWSRIAHMPNAEYLYRQISANSKKGGGDDSFSSFNHSLLSTSPLSTGDTGMTRMQPGGIVQLAADTGGGPPGTVLAAEMVKMYELWVKDADDYTTIQIIEPDILIAPRFKKSNLLFGGGVKSMLHPYTLIQPNQAWGNVWGRSELEDLAAPQELLSIWTDDLKRLFGLQIDKILGFQGGDDIPEERYGQMRAAGFINAGMGSTITDLTPKMPPEGLQMLDFMIKIINMIGGFDNILSGQGEPGVRAGVHADTMMKTASPRLRDRSLLVERQCAAAGDLRLSLMEAKDGSHFWTDGSNEAATEKSKFILADLPEDRRVTVDSHSSSPIFADDHQQLIAFGVKAGFVDGHSAIDELPFPHKKKLQQRLKAKEEAAQKQLQELKQANPEAFAKLLEKSGGHHK